MVYHGSIKVWCVRLAGMKRDQALIPFSVCEYIGFSHCFESETGSVWLVNVTNVFGKYGTFTMVIL